MRVVRRLSSIVAVSVVGTLLLAAGVVMLVTPGPGLLAIIAGLAVWAREFRWARSLLDRARQRLRGGRGPAVADAASTAGPDPSARTPDDGAPRTRRAA